MRTEVCHFWFGKFKSEDEYFDFIGEDESYYSEDDIEEKYLSEFAKSQDRNHLDHDFMESGFEDENIAFEDKFLKYSYASEWILEAKEKLIQQNQNIEEINTVIFISKDQIKNPISIHNSDFNLLYIGEIEYEI
ncbi:immunity 22 family protein [Flavobacterium sp. LPB0248]|uniref:immunity 22 family protein n=1 Tax=Flavobacterium sp. LPB0248 TaxID=2614441 RepID=UPI0015A6C0EC|nr:immunity 22 family protein [Flavobacterium sp. LPB0248]QLC66547.1 immunity 22 family protein [Flavobacterium sp. LPB0248]